MARKVFNMNFDWRFHDGDIVKTGYESVHDTRFDDPTFLKAGNCGLGKWGYDDSKWDTVQVPHDFRVYRGEYDPENVPEPEGYLTMGTVWYRKSFVVEEAMEGKRLFLEFDGVYRDCEIYVNGHYLGRELGGYTSFAFEFSDVALYGQPNVVAVKVKAEQYEGWWYEAAGIYRDVRMVVVEPIHVIKDGVFIRTYDEEDKKKLVADVTINNDSPLATEIGLVLTITSPKGSTLVNKNRVSISPYEMKSVEITDIINNPVLWDVDAPNIYTYKIDLVKGGTLLDTYEGTFGIKDVEFSPEKGVILNGRALKIKGVCVHDDFAVVGGGMTESVIRHKIQVLKDMGCNAYRCSHNPPSPYLLQACDEIGLLVMDEVRLMSTADEYVRQMDILFKRDRNHPSIFIWSIGNEEMNIHGTPTGVKIMSKLQRMAHDLDDTRPVTYANNCDWNEITRFHEAKGLHMDVFGFNYYCQRQFDMYDGIHRDFPNTMIIGTENGSGQSTRGQYLPREEELNPAYYSEREKTTSVWANPKRKYNVSAYCESYPVWGSTPLETIKAADKDYVAGYFVWTGFDYRGEIFPFTWPSTIARYGIIDL